MTVQVDTDLERGFGQLYEIQKRFLNGSLSPLAARQPLQDIIEGKFPVTSRYDRHRGLLLSLEDQLNKLIDFNERFWGGLLTSEEFTAIDISSDHVQFVDDLEILYVDFGSPEKNIEMWWKAIAGNQPNAWRWDGLKTDPKHLRLGSNTHLYDPGMRGIHRVCINLVANWEPEKGRSVLQVREQAARSGEYLAHAEVLAAYGLHDELLQRMDGENLPYADMAGFEATVPGSGPWSYVPDLYLELGGPWNSFLGPPVPLIFGHEPLAG